MVSGKSMVRALQWNFFNFLFADSEESDRQEVRVSNGWSVYKDTHGVAQWILAEKKILDSKHPILFSIFEGQRRRQVRSMTFEQVMLSKSSLCLEEKKLWLFKYLEKQRVPFVDDREILVINRENLVQESFDAFQTFLDLNLHKELQIFFVGEKA